MIPNEAQRSNHELGREHLSIACYNLDQGADALHHDPLKRVQIRRYRDQVRKIGAQLKSEIEEADRRAKVIEPAKPNDTRRPKPQSPKKRKQKP